MPDAKTCVVNLLYDFAPLPQSTELMAGRGWDVSSSVWVLGKAAPSDLFPIIPTRTGCGPFRVIITYSNDCVTNPKDEVLKTGPVLII